MNKLSYYQPLHTKSITHGVIVPLSAMMLAAMIGLVGIGFYIMGYGASTENARNTAKLITLGALEAYMGETCSRNVSVSDCHSLKMDAALERANVIAERNTGGLSSVTFVDGRNHNQGGSGIAVLTPLRWYHTQPTGGSNPCAGQYPCGQAAGANELANAMRLEGTVTDSFSSLLSFGFMGLNGTESVVYRTTAVASPMHAMFIVDLSSSIAEDSHLAAEAAESLSDNAAVMAQRGNDFWGSFYAYNATLDKDHTKTFPADSQRQFFFAYDEGSTAVANVWNTTVSHGSRDNNKNPPSPYDHFEDDYRIVFSYEETANGRSHYDAVKRDHHPSVDGVNVVERVTPLSVADQGAAPILLDKYRGHPVYTGAQPLNTIVKGVRTFINQMESRQVAGDKAGLVFADDKMTWNRVVNLTSDIAYLNSVLDFDSDASDPNPYAPKEVVDPSSVVTNPRWIQLQLFPLPNRNTDLFGALTMASTQLATNGNITALPGSQASVVPSVDFTVLFTDGLGNCAPRNGKSSCSNNYTGYSASKTAIDSLAYNSFFKSKVPIHVIMAGKQSGPHLLLHPKQIDAEEGGKAYECMSEEEVRQGAESGMRSVDSPTCTSPSLCQIAFNERFVHPFTIAVKDWYDIAVRTGGVFFPLMTTSSGCTPVDPAAACEDGVTARFTQDPQCRSIEQQLESALDLILKNSHAFTIVESN